MPAWVREHPIAVSAIALVAVAGPLVVLGGVIGRASAVLLVTLLAPSYIAAWGRHRGRVRFDWRSFETQFRAYVDREEHERPAPPEAPPPR